ncbi:DUF3854 domain-containing protein [Microcoleus sp. A006_D1]|uniref:DUF3854 domain-containing protein n=1 Tax=Microcoleus sp. A006_D1 TaxID=3055267 RepID=UPI002FD60DEB
MNYTTISTTLVNSNKYLSKAHQEHIAQRGLLSDRAMATCRTVSAEEASLILSTPAKSGGILIEGDSLQSQFRPDKRWKVGNKLVPKYLTPKTDHGYDAILPTDPELKNYWEPETLKKSCYQLNGHPCLLITEGGFKAIAGCDNNLPTIGLIGVEMGLSGRKSDTQGKRYLIESLEKYAKAGIGFIIVFDADATTNPNIRRAQRTLGRQLLKFDVPLYVATGGWEMGENGENKGMDDFIQNRSIEEFRAVLAKSGIFNDEDSDEDDASKTKKQPPASKSAQEMAESYKSKLAWESEYQFWRYYGAEFDGCWDIATEETVRGLIQNHLEFLGRDYSAGYVTSIATILKSKLEVKNWNERRGLIPLRDGVLDQKTQKLKPHAPGYKFTYQLPFSWAERSIGCAPIEEFLLKISGQSEIAEVLLAFLNCVVTGRSDLQRYLELIGGGGTGKSTFMALAKALIGDENAVSSQLRLLESNRFETAMFYRKRLILFPDSERWQGEVGILKQLTGQDPIRYERKGVQQSRDFVFEGMVILSANEAPDSADRTSGQERRKLTIGLDNKISEYEGRDLKKEFEPYLPGLLQRALEIPHDRVTQLIKHTDRTVPALALKKFQQLTETNPIAGWLDERVVAGDYKTYVGTGNPESAGKWLYANFCQFQQEMGHKNSLPMKRFSSNLRDLLKNQLNLDISEGRDRNGAFIGGIGLRCQVDPLQYLPRPVTKKPFCDGFKSENDAIVTAENLTNSGCDGFDGFSEDFSKFEKIALTSEAQDLGSIGNIVKKTENPSQPDSVKITATEKPQQSQNESITTPSNLAIGQKVKISQKFSGRQQLRGKSAEIIKDLGSNLYQVKFEGAGITVSGHGKVKTANVSSAQLLTECEVELVEFIRACEDAEGALDIQKILTECCDRNEANRAKVWAELTSAEQSKFKALLN